MAAVLSLAALVALSYVAGAAVMHFELPSSAYLENSFTGAGAWWERAGYATRPAPGPLKAPDVTIDKPDRTYDGFTLYTTTTAARAVLVDMRGLVVHEWQLPFRQAWPQVSHVKDPFPDDLIHWFRCYLYPNGDLLAVYHADGDTPYGYGLAKMDKDSKLLWTYSKNVHHDIDVDDDGRIYTLTQKFVSTPPPELPYQGPYLADHLVILSPEGQELESIPILEAFRDSPYAPSLDAISRPTPSMGAQAKKPNRGANATLEVKGDILHTNSVKVLHRSMAAKFPLFKPGQVLISLRRLNTVAVLDPSTRCIIWASNGCWQSQHDAEILDNGHLLVFDNLGSVRGARVLEFDPITLAVPWTYANEKTAPIFALLRGMKQRLPNGNTLLTDPDGGRILEVTVDKDIVWECFCLNSLAAPNQDATTVRSITGAHRYGPKELTFLNGGPHVRP